MHNPAELIPKVLNEEIDMDDIDLWLDYAYQALASAPGGLAVISTLKSYIADTKALITADFAYIVAYKQVQSIEAQVRETVWGKNSGGKNNAFVPSH